MFLQSSNHFDHLFPKKKLLVILCFLPQALPGVSPPFNSVSHKRVSGCVFNTGFKKKKNHNFAKRSVTFQYPDCNQNLSDVAHPKHPVDLTTFHSDPSSSLS